MDSPYIKQTVYKVLKIFQHGKYLVAYVLNDNNIYHEDNISKLPDYDVFSLFWNVK